jgi:hypothetical protein
MRRLAGLAVPLVIFVAPAHAAKTGATFALKAIGAGKTGYYVYESAPNAVIHGHVRVVNAGDEPGTASLDAVDATTGATTGAVYEQAAKHKVDVGTWIALDTRQVTLDPGASAVVNFTVTVPSDARRGDHLGGIVAAPVETQAAAKGDNSKKSFHVNVVEQAVVAIQVGLPGAARSKLAVRGVKAGGNGGYQTLVLALSNPGELMVKGRGAVQITDKSGKVVGDQRFNIDTFLPRTRIDYPLVVRGKALLPGSYQATVSLDWGSDQLRQAFPFSVSRKDIKQAFGSEGVAKLDGKGSGGGGGGGLGLIIAAVALALLLGVGGSMFWFRRQTRRLEERLTARREADEPRFTQEREEDRERSER